jgi:hypothetical protein
VEERIEKTVTELRFTMTGTIKLGQTATEDADQTIQFVPEWFKARGGRHGESLPKSGGGGNSVTTKSGPDLKEVPATLPTENPSPRNVERG